MPVYEKRRAVVKAINKFWPVALMNHDLLAVHAQHNADQAALSYLEDLWLVRDPVESRCFTLEFVSVVLCISDRVFVRLGFDAYLGLRCPPCWPLCLR